MIENFKNSKYAVSVVTAVMVVFLYSLVHSDAQTADAAPPENLVPALAAVSANPVYQFSVINNIVYGQGLQRSGWQAPGGQPINLVLHAYLPNTPAHRLRPAIMLFHGGGFKGGDAGYPRMVEIASYYASRGWAVFSVNYRLESDYGSLPENWPIHPNPAIYPAGRDAKAAVRWLHANAAQYHVSRDHITVFGGSAGAMLAIMLGVSDGTDYRSEIPIEVDPTLLTTNLESPARVQTVISFWGGGHLLNALEEYDGQNRYGSNDTPTLLIHGTNDTVVPLYYSEQVYLALTHYGVPAQLEILQGGKHGDWEAIVADGRTLYQTAFEFIVQLQDLPHE